MVMSWGRVGDTLGTLVPMGYAVIRPHARRIAEKIPLAPATRAKNGRKGLRGRSGGVSRRPKDAGVAQW